MLGKGHYESFCCSSLHSQFLCHVDLLLLCVEQISLLPLDIGSRPVAYLLFSKSKDIVIKVLSKMLPMVSQGIQSVVKFRNVLMQTGQPGMLPSQHF